ncbi:MAG TPA: glycosyltransferase [Oscillatoriaceae cyanobacterium]
MNLMLITNQLGIGGAEQFVVHLANQLSERHRVLVVSSGGVLTQQLSAAVTHLEAPLKGMGPREAAIAVRCVREALAQHAIDLVHAQSFNSALVARLAGARQVLASAHGGLKPWKKPLVAAVYGACAQRVVGCAETISADFVRHGLGAARIQTIPNAIPLPASPEADVRERVRAELGLESDTPLILGVGRLSEEKGFCTMLEALAILARLNPRVHAAIAGDGPLRGELEARARALGLSQLHFLGRRADVARLMGAADALCLPSRAEGLPLALLEAMACRLPIVASDVGGVHEAVVDGVTGWLVPPRDPLLLATRLLAVLEDPARGRAMGEAGRERIAARFAFPRLVSSFEELYASMLRDAQVAQVPAYL